jgi:hypothetical protein
MAKKYADTVCPQCGHSVSTDPKIPCKNCGYNGVFPLNTSTKIGYTTITFMVFLVVYAILSGGRGYIGAIGLIAPWKLFQDWKNNKKIKEYQVKHKIKAFNYPEEKNGLMKGLIYSVFIVVASFILGAFLLNDSTGLGYSLTSPNDTESTSWQNFSSVDEGFTATFPTYPVRESVPATIVNGITYSATIYSSSVGTQTHMVLVGEYDVSPENFNNETGLEGGVNGMLNSLKGGVLESSSYIKYGQYDAVYFLMSSEQEGISIEGKAIIRDDLPRVKTYFIATQSNMTDVSSYDKFVNSFAFTK